MAARALSRVVAALGPSSTAAAQAPGRVCGGYAGAVASPSPPPQSWHSFAAPRFAAAAEPTAPSSPPVHRPARRPPQSRPSPTAAAATGQSQPAKSTATLSSPSVGDAKQVTAADAADGDLEASNIRAMESAKTASELGAQLGRLVTTWEGAPSAKMLTAAIKQAERLRAMHLVYALIYQVRLYGTTQYVKRLTPAVYEALLIAASNLAGDDDVVLLSDRMLQDAILPTTPSLVVIFKTLLRTADQRRLWLWYNEYRSRPKGNVHHRDGTGPDAVAAGKPWAEDRNRLPAALEAAVRHALGAKQSGSRTD